MRERGWTGRRAGREVLFGAKVSLSISLFVEEPQRLHKFSTWPDVAYDSPDPSIFYPPPPYPPHPQPPPHTLTVPP